MDVTSRTRLKLQPIALAACALCACGGSRLSHDEGGDLSALSSPRAVDCEHPRAKDTSPAAVALWPPNHKTHLISVGQCLPALAGCGPELDAEFEWASSDEPIDGIGDGHHAPDIFRVDRGHVCVRSERQGPKNGRTYRLGLVLTISGVRSHVECVVLVDHDQRGALAQDDGELYRVTFDDADDGASCDGAPPDPGEPGAPRPPRAPEPPPVAEAPPATEPAPAPPAAHPPAPRVPETPDAGALPPRGDAGGPV